MSSIDLFFLSKATGSKVAMPFYIGCFISIRRNPPTWNARPKFEGKVIIGNNISALSIWSSAYVQFERNTMAVADSPANVPLRRRESLHDNRDRSAARFNGWRTRGDFRRNRIRDQFWKKPIQNYMNVRRCRASPWRLTICICIEDIDID